MNKKDKEILALNWDMQRERSRRLGIKFSLDLSSSCYVEFGVVGLAIYKHRQGKWYRKIVNYWKELAFEEFMEAFEKAAWEKA